LLHVVWMKASKLCPSVTNPVELKESLNPSCLLALLIGPLLAMIGVWATVPVRGLDIPEAISLMRAVFHVLEGSPGLLVVRVALVPSAPPPSLLGPIRRACYWSLSGVKACGRVGEESGCKVDK
jgi:hypothetical protein